MYIKSLLSPFYVTFNAGNTNTEDLARIIHIYIDIIYKLVFYPKQAFEFSQGLILGSTLLTLNSCLLRDKSSGDFQLFY